MLKIVKTSDLKPGMFVVLPYSWLKKLFVKHSFKLTNKEEITAIQNEGLIETYIDLAKSTILDEEIPNGELVTNPTFYPKDYRTPKEDSHLTIPIIKSPDINTRKISIDIWANESFEVEQFYDVLSSQNINGKEKAKEVYQETIKLINSLMHAPTATKIKESKKNIYKLVDFILKEEDAASWLTTITTHDYYTYTHSVNVGFLSIMLAKKLFRDNGSHNLHELGAAFFLHDIGKTKIPSSIINSPNKLSFSDLKTMRQHPQHGYKILQDAHELSEECKLIVLQHHERADGKGYPLGLKNDEIHIYAKICALADVYDALTAQRSYKIGHTPFESLQIMKNEMISHFDSDLFAKFVHLLS